VPACWCIHRPTWVDAACLIGPNNYWQQLQSQRLFYHFQFVVLLFCNHQFHVALSTLNYKASCYSASALCTVQARYRFINSVSIRLSERYDNRKAVRCVSAQWWDSSFALKFVRCNNRSVSKSISILWRRTPTTRLTILWLLGIHHHHHQFIKTTCQTHLLTY